MRTMSPKLQIWYIHMNTKGYTYHWSTSDLKKIMWGTEAEVNCDPNILWDRRYDIMIFALLLFFKLNFLCHF